METKASHSGELVIPDSFMEAYLCYRLQWSIHDLRSTPAHIIEQIQFIWHIETLAEKAANRGK